MDMFAIHLLCGCRMSYITGETLLWLFGNYVSVIFASLLPKIL